jgi:hypothetical protein
MRKLRIVWLVCCLAIGLNACATFESSRRPSHPDTVKACAEWRWIGISQPEAPCPEVPGWTVRPMFPQLSPVPPSGDLCEEQESKRYRRQIDAVRDLNRFCVYEIKNQKKKLQDLALPSAASAGLVRLDQDCAALSLTAAETDKIWKPESSDFLARVGKPSPSTPLRIENRPEVRLAFLDTQPTGDGAPAVSGNSPHGYTLAHIARQMICDPNDQSRCAARITTRLALPIIKFNAKSPKLSEIDPKNGGFLGMQSDLATAIIDEVRSWQQQNSQRHLVLNLSMAWDGELFGGLDEEQITEMRAGSQAVYKALQYAAEFDVLVLAAAGNQKRDPCTNFGPLLPAAWEKEAPHASCHENAQLLYAVGGLQSNDTPLDNARPGGMPRRVAYGEAAIFSGSSVATAVASSIAAVVWSAFPDFDSHKIMAILDDSGQTLFPADFWFSGASKSAPMAHKLTLCDALRQACGDNHTLAICNIQCDPVTLPESSKLFGKPAKKVIWKGSCQPWLFPQPEDPIRACPETGPCSDTRREV